VDLPPPHLILVATDGVHDRVAAYCAVGAVREPQDSHPSLPTGELFAIYADPTVWGRGAGHAVHEHAVAALAARGVRCAVLWVFEDNQRARVFYERHGWRSDGLRQELEVGGQRPWEVRYSTNL
jgi:ribosomal protein S18 acetylase RimI-like enzyme